MNSAAGPKPRVLFACTYNAVRSPMAAALLVHYAGARLSVTSAGVIRGLNDPFAMAVMDEIGIDLTSHEPREFRDLGRHTFDTIITLSPEAHHHALEFTRIMLVDVEYWPTFDPSLLSGDVPRARKATAYRALRDQLDGRIRNRFKIDGGPTV
ncbi:MAG: low molecular weight phosphatase family protein [Hyphomicrobium sp.]|nr:low molecular weight phosphatase family protein [Hyphomicrobium sp.]